MTISGVCPVMTITQVNRCAASHCHAVVFPRVATISIPLVDLVPERNSQHNETRPAPTVPYNTATIGNTNTIRMGVC